MKLIMTYNFFFSSGTYYAAVIENRVDFNGRVVVDVGAGSGILSLFAAQVCSKIFMHKVFLKYSKNAGPSYKCVQFGGYVFIVSDLDFNI